MDIPAQMQVYPLLSKEQFQAAEAAGIQPLQAQILHNRGMTTPATMKAFLEASYDATPDPLTLIDMPRAISRIREALEHDEHITVYGDYDADGVTSSSLLYRALRRLRKSDTSRLSYHIPHRLHDGCGLNLTALDLIKTRGTSLIITTDCASSDVEQVEYARSLGIDVIITDHHHPPAQLPAAYAMVNPWRPDATYGERYLCGAGIAFKLVQALYRSYQLPRSAELELLDLVAVGTIADVAPLLGENHTLARLGMQYLNQTQKPGLKALITNARLTPGKIRERDIAFALAPRINAAGRMKEAAIAFELLTTDDEQEAIARASELDQLNLTRQQETEELMRNVRLQAENQPGNHVILVSGDDWHEGIIGLVAGKLAEEVQKPVLVLSNDRQTHLSRGSARSQKDYDIIEALRGFSDHLVRFGGHSQAAGFTIRSEMIEQLHHHLQAWKGGPTPIIASTAPLEETGLEPEPAPVSSPQMIDLVFTKIERVNYELYKTIRALSPFGAANPEPIFKMERVRLLGTWFSGINNQNLRLRLAASNGSSQRVLGTLSKGASRRQEFIGVERVDIIFKIDSFEDENKPEIWLKILSVIPSA